MLYLLNTGLCISGMYSLWMGCMLNILFGYVVYTPMHEAAHGNINPRHKGIDAVVGWACGVLLLAPFSAFKMLHLRHHRHTNDPEKDPDYWVASGNIVWVALKCLSIVPNYYYHFLIKPSKASKKHRTATLIGLLFLAGALVLLSTLFGWKTMMVLWVVPALSAFAILAFVLDWIPHHPHRTTSRFLNTRIILFPGLSLFMINHHLHLVHHLYPCLPFHKYGEAFQKLRPMLEENGTPIMGTGKHHRREKA